MSGAKTLETIMLVGWGSRDGGRLTGLWWPRLEWVSVPAHRRWFERAQG